MLDREDKIIVIYKRVGATEFHSPMERTFSTHLMIGDVMARTDEGNYGWKAYYNFDDFYNIREKKREDIRAQSNECVDMVYRMVMDN